MAFETKIAANRRNAQRSTGPRTALGKVRVRRNALRHGFAAVVVGDLGVARVELQGARPHSNPRSANETAAPPATMT